MQVKTVITYRNKMTKGQGYELRDAENKKTTQRDIDDAYKRTLSNLSLSIKATNQISRSDAKKMLTQAAPAAEGGSSSFDGGRMVLQDIVSLCLLICFSSPFLADWVVLQHSN